MRLHFTPPRSSSAVHAADDTCDTCGTAVRAAACSHALEEAGAKEEVAQEEVEMDVEEAARRAATRARRGATMA